ncbi:MAG: hypothetical protein EHM28_03650 [Spirochaetaceae bacterium]|nr:MAG: hypothetical protein EHM28_03650 [Spirochaetaceae bacterium]
MNSEKALKNSSLFAYIPNRILKSIAPFFKEKRITRADPAVAGNTPDDAFFMIVSGKVKIHYLHNVEQELLPGEYFCETVLFGRKSKVEHAFPVGESAMVVYIERNDFFHCLDAYPLLATVITNILAERLASRGISGYERDIGSYTILGEASRNEKEVRFYGEHSILKRPVLIQLIPHLFAHDPKYVERLLSKLKVIANFASDFIIKPIDVVKVYNTFFIIYDIEGGVSLTDIMEKSKSIPHPIISFIVLETARVLSTLHSQTLFHTDLRPDNIIITRDGEIKIGNFGIMHPDYCMIEFMSPEQIRKKQLDRTSDIYSLGIITYLLAAGKLPFEAREEQSMLRLKQNSDYTPLASINPLLPFSLVQFVSRSLEPKPEKRLENLKNLPDLFKLWLDTSGKKDAVKDDKPEPISASRDMFIQWLKKKFFQTADGEISGNGNGKKIKITASKNIQDPRSSYESLFEKQDEFYSFKLLTFEEFFESQSVKRAMRNHTAPPGEISTQFQIMEHERQELIIIHTLTKQLLKSASRRDIFTILPKMLQMVEKSGSWVLIAKKEKKIKNQADRIAMGSHFPLDPAVDHALVERAETLKEPEVLREKSHYVLVCPLMAGNRYIGCVCLADRLKPLVDARMKFYRLLHEVMPAARVEA